MQEKAKWSSSMKETHKGRAARQAERQSREAEQRGRAEAHGSAKRHEVSVPFVRWGRGARLPGEVLL